MTSSPTPQETELEKLLNTFAKWTIGNTEHGILIPLISPETIAAIQQLVAEVTEGDDCADLCAMHQELTGKHAETCTYGPTRMKIRQRAKDKGLLA